MVRKRQCLVFYFSHVGDAYFADQKLVDFEKQGAFHFRRNVRERDHILQPFFPERNQKVAPLNLALSAHVS
jgi:hypothetical protein